MTIQQLLTYRNQGCLSRCRAPDVRQAVALGRMPWQRRELGMEFWTLVRWGSSVWWLGEFWFYRRPGLMVGSWLAMTWVTRGSFMTERTQARDFSASSALTTTDGRKPSFNDG